MLVIPVGHDQPSRSFAWITAVIIAACVLFQLEQLLVRSREGELEQLLAQRKERVIALHQMRGEPGGDGDLDDRAFHDEPSVAELDARIERTARLDPVMRFGYRPVDGLSPTLLSAVFLHAGWVHLVGNMLFLWLVGKALEDRWGPAFFGLFYLAGGIAASLIYAAFHPASKVPLVGASGAIAAAMGAFLVACHDARIRFWYFFWFLLFIRRGFFHLRAWFVLPLWFALQLLSFYDETHGAGDDVAYSAHVGGFAFGVVVAFALRWSGIEARLLLPAADRAHRPTGSTGRREDVDYEAAQAALARGDRGGALVLLKKVIARTPRHPGAQLELCRIGIALGERGYPRLWGSEVVIHLCERRGFVEARDLYGAICVQWPELTFSDRAMHALMRSAIADSDLVLALQLAARLPVDHPRSSLAPAALFEMAESLVAGGRADLAEQQLRRLVALFPDDRFAASARERLGAPPARPLDEISDEISIDLDLDAGPPRGRPGR